MIIYRNKRGGYITKWHTVGRNLIAWLRRKHYIYDAVDVQQVMATPIPEGWEYDINTDTLTNKETGEFGTFTEQMWRDIGKNALHKNKGTRPTSEEVSESTGLLSSSCRLYCCAATSKGS